MVTTRILVLASAILAVAFSAESPKPPAANNGKWKNRGITVDSSSPALLKVTSIAGTDTGRTIAQWVIGTARGGDLRIRSSYQTVDKTDKTKTIESSTFLTRFSAIVEYVDANNNKKFDVGEAKGIYRIGLGEGKPGVAPVKGPGVDWRREYRAAATEGGLNTLTATTTDGVFGVKVAFSSQQQTIDGVLVPPTQIKFDANFNFTNYVWASPDSRIALLARVVSKEVAGVKDIDATQKSASVTKQVTSGSNAMTWANTIKADGVSVAVTTDGITPPAQVDGTVANDDNDANSGTDKVGEKDNIVVFNFDVVRPKIMVWDPTVGLDATIDQETPAAASSSVVTASAAALVLAALALIM